MTFISLFNFFIIFGSGILVFIVYYLCQSECSEHWRRLRDWSFCPLFCVYTMTHRHLHDPHVIHKQTSGPARHPDICTPY